MKIPEATDVTLEGGEKVVTIPCHLVAENGLGRSPDESILICDHMTVEVVIRVRGVAIAMPHTTAGWPVQPGCRKVGTEHPFHPVTRMATCLTGADPSPELLGAGGD
jgi:hypothetical protein